MTDASEVRIFVLLAYAYIDLKLMISFLNISRLKCL